MTATHTLVAIIGIMVGAGVAGLVNQFTIGRKLLDVSTLLGILTERVKGQDDKIERALTMYHDTMGLLQKVVEQNSLLVHQLENK